MLAFLAALLTAAQRRGVPRQRDVAQAEAGCVARAGTDTVPPERRGTACLRAPGDEAGLLAAHPEGSNANSWAPAPVAKIAASAGQLLPRVRCVHKPILGEGLNPSATTGVPVTTPGRGEGFGWRATCP